MSLNISATSIITGISNLLASGRALAAEFANSNDPVAHQTAATSLMNLFEGFGASVTASTAIGVAVADSLELAKNGNNAQADLLTDITSAAAANGVTLGGVEEFLLSDFLSAAQTEIAKLEASKKN